MPISFFNRILAPPAERINKSVSVSFYRFVATESSSGIVLIVIAALAIGWANSPWSERYFALWETDITIALGNFALSMHLLHWINDGLMAIFFLVVGLEIKREMVAGELSSPSKAMLPIATALGGMAVPALIFVLFNLGKIGLRGWATPMATDIAFALGILTLAGSRVPIGLKVILTALAIVDDLGAVLVIALFYTSELHLAYLGSAAIVFGLLVVLNIAKVRNNLLYVAIGVFLWYFLLKSGVHATVAGVLLALTIPARSTVNPVKFLKDARQNLTDFKLAIEQADDPATRSDDMQNALHKLETDTKRVESPLVRLEYRLKNWSAFLIMPVFALANAGVVIDSKALQHINSPVLLGTFVGLFLGKQLGIVAFAWLAVRLKLAELPAGVSWGMVYGLACLGGIGFTMALFIAELSFAGIPEHAYAKLGILCATVSSAVYGILVLKGAFRKALTT